MAVRTKEMVKKARETAGRAGKAVATARREIKRQIRRRQIKRTIRHAGEAALAAGTAALVTVIAEEGSRALRRELANRSVGGIGFEADLPVPPEAAIGRVTEALKSEGFGVLTRIDAHTTFKEKLGITVPTYVILGVCNPELAHRALAHRAEAGLLLPCNVTIEDRGNEGSTVRIGDPAALLKVGRLGRDPVLREIAAEARERLERAALAVWRTPS